MIGRLGRALVRRGSVAVPAMAVAAVAVVAACSGRQEVPPVSAADLQGAPAGGAAAGAPAGVDPQVLRGRSLVLHHGCGDCHSLGSNPNQPKWLAGVTDSALQTFQIGPFTTFPRNLTPDNTTGLGRFTERQIFNALRYGLRPGETPDVEITSNVPGQGNFPMNPKYLAIPMPWPSFRHMPDDDLRAIAAYLKRGVKPVSNRVPDSQGPPDFWASEYTPEKIGTYPAPPFPAAGEVSP